MFKKREVFAICIMGTENNHLQQGPATAALLVLPKVVTAP